MDPRQLSIRLPIAIILFFVAWELCARVDDKWTHGAPFSGLYDQSVLMTTDQFGITGRPNARYLKWNMNSHGFRGPELQENRQTILCIGASETFGIYEPEGLEFPRQLEHELNTDNKRYQVVNAGLPGQSLSSFARRAVQVVREVRPTTTVLYPSLAIYIDPPPEQFDPSLQPGEPKFRFRIAGKLFSLLGDNIPDSIQTAFQQLEIRGATRHIPVMSRIPDSAVDRFHGDLAHLLDVLESEKTEPILVTHANRFGSTVSPEDRPFLIAWRALHPMLEEDGFLDMEKRLNDVIRSEAASRSLPLIDVANYMHGAGDFVEYVHFTPAGAKKVAVAVANIIEAQSGQAK